MVLSLQVLLLLSFANGMPSADDSALERVFSLSIAGAHLSLSVVCIARNGRCCCLQCHPYRDTYAVRPGLEADVWRANTGSGLIAFALTVALVQQSVRGAIETNVKTGGTLFEIDHVRAVLLV